MQNTRYPDHAWISVTDQGIGLSEDELVHAFERHFRGTVAKALRPEGAGLGLAIARDIVTAHHGEDGALVQRAGNHAGQTLSVYRF